LGRYRRAREVISAGQKEKCLRHPEATPGIA
jgi:hypothetical protein